MAQEWPHELHPLWQCGSLYEVFTFHTSEYHARTPRPLISKPGQQYMGNIKYHTPAAAGVWYYKILDSNPREPPDPSPAKPNLPDKHPMNPNPANEDLASQTP
ncbi:hypothetical protein BS47DRAFT_1365450 [Hydnum rufescens UP504]|uniref:Uncharacterized protein n=1 Tax=Hydnum rufescens UP504 TaxID=1448309 RepID=A0A9P6ANL8_9AGAM|nr:hypothetical protein BS47DRAFT_1365450 [Hydnum rufescens UP504]